MSIKSIKVLVVGANAVTNEAIKAALKSKTDIEIIGLIETGKEGIGSIEYLNPDVVLIDSSTPDIDSILLLRLIIDRTHNAKTILMSQVNDPVWMRSAIQAGVHNFLPLPPDDDQIYNVIAVW